MWVTRAITVSLLGATTVACGGTQKHLEPGEIRVLPFTNIQHVNGLRGTVDSARAANEPVRVLFMHGMITWDSGYSRPHQAKIAERLALETAGPDSVFSVIRGYRFTVMSGPQPFVIAPPDWPPNKPPVGGELLPAEIRRTTWVERANPSVVRLIAYELRWADLRDAAKNRFLACYETGPVRDGYDCDPFTKDYLPNTDRRASANYKLKRGLLVRGLADAAVVLSPFGDVLRDDVDLTMCIIARDELRWRGIPVSDSVGKRCDLGVLASDRAVATNAARTLERARFAAITHSLGSFLLMDQQFQAAVRRASPNALATVQSVRETLPFFLLDQKTVFMLANQVSLLGLGRLDAVCETTDPKQPCPNRALKKVDDYIKAAKPSATMTTWVAFNDVNDLLGYELPGYLPEVGSTGALINVTVRNPGFRFLRSLKDPNAAHTKQADNPAIIEAIVEGFDVPRAGPAQSLKR